jgi:hypothetical protein
MVTENNSKLEPRVDAVEKSEEDVEPTKPSLAGENNSKLEPRVDAVEKSEEDVEPTKPSFHKQTIICIGEYPIKLLLKGSLVKKKDEPLPIFIGKSSEDVAEWSRPRLNPDNILGLDLNIDTHFWFQVLPKIANDGALIARLKDKSIDNLGGALIVSSLWDGVSSGLLPALISQFKEWNTNTVAFGVLPSQIQIPDVHFNAFASIGLCVSKGFASLLLFDRDQLERYVGVDRKGSVLKGNVILNYLLELVSAKEKFVQELSELSRAFDVRMYTVLSATGTSLSIYGSIKNILDSALSRPLLKFDLSSASVIYVLIRMPIQLKEILSRGKIELEIADWFKEKASLKSIVVSDPIYVEDSSDRIDIVMFVGGFDVTKMFISMEKKVREMKNFVIKQDSIKEDEWQAIVKSIVAS